MIVSQRKYNLKNSISGRLVSFASYKDIYSHSKLNNFIQLKQKRSKPVGQSIGPAIIYVIFWYLIHNRNGIEY